MSVNVWLSLFALSLLLPYNEACTSIHLLCSDIKTAGGYRYVTNATVEAQAIEVREVQSRTIISLMEKKKFQLLKGVVSEMDNVSVTTHECRNLQIKRVNKKGDTIYDTCEDFIVLDDSPKALTSMNIGKKTLIGVPVTLLFLMTPLCVLLLVKYILWRRKRQRNRLDASFSVYLTKLRGRCPCRGRTNVAHNGGHADQRVAEMENGLNTQQEQLLNVKSDSNDVNVNKFIIMDEITGTNNNKDVPPISGDFPHVGQNGDMWQDPGSRKADTKLHGNHKCLKGGTLGAQSPNRDKDEEQHSPRSQGSGGPGYFAGGEGGELVHSHGSGSDESTSPGEKKEANEDDV